MGQGLNTLVLFRLEILGVLSQDSVNFSDLAWHSIIMGRCQRGLQ